MPGVYDPMKDVETLVLKAVGTGLMCFKRDTPDAKIQTATRTTMIGKSAVKSAVLKIGF